MRLSSTRYGALAMVGVIFLSVSLATRLMLTMLAASAFSMRQLGLIFAVGFAYDLITFCYLAAPAALVLLLLPDRWTRSGWLRVPAGALYFAAIFLFLFSLRSTFVAAISIPLSVLTALVLMQVTDISLNFMTLGGLAVAVGRVVDDAIVVLENIYRHRALGEDKLTAVTKGPREVARAITASTRAFARETASVIASCPVPQPATKT